MGKVRNETIKKFARSLIEKFPDKFAQDYEENKKIIGEVAEINSKKLRNQIAGYITSLVSRTSEVVQESSEEIDATQET